jgi:hypothetical protein
LNIIAIAVATWSKRISTGPIVVGGLGVVVAGRLVGAAADFILRANPIIIRVEASVGRRLGATDRETESLKNLVPSNILFVLT